MNVFATVKTSINTREAAARYGVEVNRHGKAPWSDRVRCGEEAGIRLRHHTGQAAYQSNAGKTE